MSDYVVSARKYRPDSFESLIGQDNIARTLRNSILRGQLSHAYLFCGPRGVGKTSTARLFAKTINCSNPGEDMKPCGECESCLSFQEGRSYCIHELDAASNNGVEDIKALMEKVQIPPQTGRYSVFIIDEVHMLSQAAFNAFLKTLEEPPAHAIFILATTEKHKILPTILSRCQTYDFNRISIPDIVRNLTMIASREGVNIDQESLHVIARKADGAMRDALTIFDQTVAFCGSDIRYEDVVRNLNELDYEYSFRLVDAFLAGNYAETFLIFDDILSKGFNALHFLDALSSHLRDLLVSRTGGLETLLDLPDSLKERYRQQARNCSVKFIYDALGVTTQAEAQYRSSTNQRLLIEFSLMKLCFLNKTPEAERQAAPAPVAAATAAAAPAPVQPPVAAATATAAPAEPAATRAQEPAPQPQAPQVAPRQQSPAPASPAPRAPRKTGASLSLNALMSEDKSAEAAADGSAAVEVEEKLPEDSVLAECWQRLAAMQTAQPRLMNALSNAALSFSDRDSKRLIRFTVASEAQKKWIEDRILRDLEEKLRSLCSCSRILLEPEVAAEEEKAALKYMPAEKAEDLISKNEEVRNLVVDLGLDIK
ncbi:MAG: DNA polymerase III subunit gamma/tau [Bacteroidales bacterium]|nr:DNA polymerase III subunit gamma/tau [Bacteroidales bacterium]